VPEQNVILRPTNTTVGAKAYLLERILHDYSDQACVDILQQIVPSMAPDSLVLISDFIVPDRITPNDIEVVSSNVMMLQMGGKERTEEEFRKVFDSAGLEVVGVYKPEYGHFGVVEGKLKHVRKHGRA